MNHYLYYPNGLQGLAYPDTLFKVFVVADNCSDRTAAVARGYGALVYERRDSVHRGKGFALRWLLQRIATTGEAFDAYIFLDADCVVSPNILAVMNERFQSGSRVVQSYYIASDPFRTAVSALRFAALVLKHYVRPRGRQVLHLSCGLFGTGMGFKREILDTHDWTAFSLAEDIEYYLKLTEWGIRVDFAPEARVWSQMPTSFREAQSQNLRWEKGRLQMARRYGPRFLLRGLWKGDPVKLDAAIEQLIPPLSITGLMAGALLLMALFTGREWLIALGVITNLALLGHVFIGLLSARVPAPAYKALLYLPWLILWKLLVYSLALLPGKRQWVRTERPGP